MIVLSVISILAALAAGLVRRRGTADHRLRPWVIVCDVLALGLLAAGAVVYGNYLSEVEYDPTVGAQPALRSSQVTHDRYGRQVSLSSASLASSGSSSRP